MKVKEWIGQSLKIQRKSKTRKASSALLKSLAQSFVSQINSQFHFKRSMPKRLLRPWMVTQLTKPASKNWPLVWAKTLHSWRGLLSDTVCFVHVQPSIAKWMASFCLVPAHAFAPIHNWSPEHPFALPKTKSGCDCAGMRAKGTASCHVHCRDTLAAQILPSGTAPLAFNTADCSRKVAS